MPTSIVIKSAAAKYEPSVASFGRKRPANDQQRMFLAELDSEWVEDEGSDNIEKQYCLYEQLDVGNLEQKQAAVPLDVDGAAGQKKLL